ncbi:hypothetical protein ColLi_06267 [Colletotrichum liriopes]|uniref:Uncharacterized protein n=1 Tax=Colletotrichum liriopes TaxID=708192 RepID=A0AA37GLW4_9PEZI|nr:hypothetical protein ColLi_06267 [Colletotrichum liriopes]
MWESIQIRKRAPKTVLRRGGLAQQERNLASVVVKEGSNANMPSGRESGRAPVALRQKQLGCVWRRVPLRLTQEILHQPQQDQKNLERILDRNFLQIHLRRRISHSME